MKHVEFSGIWWMPEQAEETVAGNLTFIPGKRILLKLIGELPNVEDRDHIPLILGVTTDGKKITLYDCRVTNSRIANGFASNQITAEFAFLNHHYEAEDDLRIHSISFQFSQLSEWTGLSGFEVRQEYERPAFFRGQIVEYRFPEIVRVQSETAEISLDYTFSHDGDNLNEVHMKQVTFLKIQPREPVGFSVMLRGHFRILRNYLTFAMGSPTAALSVQMTSPGVFEINRPGLQQFRKIEVLAVFHDVDEEPARRNPREMLFHLADVREAFETSVNAWIDNHERIGPVLDLYFALRYSSNMYLEHQLLSLAQALEVLHRRVSPGRYLTEEEYAVVKEQLAAALPADMDRDIRNILRQKLEFLNEFSLRKRLQDLVRQSGTTIDLLIPNSGRFITLLTDTRNYLTHFNPQLQDRAADGIHLYWLVEQARFLLEVRLLFEMGFDGELITTLVQRNRKYGQLRQFFEENPELH